jgi:hypothetical protein
MPVAGMGASSADASRADQLRSSNRRASKISRARTVVEPRDTCTFMRRDFPS